MQRINRMQLDHSNNPIAPNPIPKDPEQLLELMDEALEHAGGAQGVGAPAFDHGMRLFNQFKAHFDLRISRELAAAHIGLTSATRALKVATWWLAAITIALGIVEGFKWWRGH